MRNLLLGTTAVVGAALIALPVAAQAPAASDLPVLPRATLSLGPGVTGSPGPLGTGLQIRLGGYMNTSFIWAYDSLDRARGNPTGVNGVGNQSRSHNDFRNEVEIHLNVSGKAANGLSYGAVVEIQNDNVGGGSGSALDLDEAYMFVSSPTLGTIRFGEEDSAAALMQVRAPSIVQFGPDGNWDVGILGSQTQTAGNPSLLTGINDGNDATKVIYLSPQFYGFDVGFSYAANNGEGDRPFQGRAVDFIGAAGAVIVPSATQRDRNQSTTQINNEFSAALRYRGSFQNVGVAASFVAMRADAARSTLSNQTAAGVVSVTAGPNLSGGQRPPDVTAYSFGLNLSAYGFTFGGEYTWGNYSGVSVGRAPLQNSPNGDKRDASSHYILGLTYVTGPWAFGTYWGQGTQDNGNSISVTTNGVAATLLNPEDRKQSAWGFGVAYTLAPGLELFANYNVVNDKNVYLQPLATVTTAGQVSNAPGSAANTVQSRNYQGLFLGTRLSF
ncbi:porin [Falsiroseomonas sp. HW251]|uniref:porin n=1 Tax=Falsiroseomonas sp. HW251 TaxID=3390998 RepID=UPI003D31609E